MQFLIRTAPLLLVALALVAPAPAQDKENPIEKEVKANLKDPAKPHRVSDIELASRLSYFLWRSMPDDELLSLAETRKLSDKTVLRAQVKRMIADPRSCGSPNAAPTTTRSCGATGSTSLEPTTQRSASSSFVPGFMMYLATTNTVSPAPNVLVSSNARVPLSR